MTQNAMMLLASGITIVTLSSAAIILDRAMRRRIPPYRTVTNRYSDGAGEVVTMECGHAYHMVRTNRASLPCTQCHEEGRR